MGEVFAYLEAHMLVISQSLIWKVRGDRYIDAVDDHAQQMLRLCHESAVVVCCGVFRRVHLLRIVLSACNETLQTRQRIFPLARSQPFLEHAPEVLN